ncbi:hypothetical protein J6590_088871 [Homalodisca vitripennis]|nr:hypothetical protein J6590_088871 [Homalodisca vitripennis]
MKKCNARGSAARDPHGIKQLISMFIRENVECLDSSFTTTTTIKVFRERVQAIAAFVNPLLETCSFQHECTFLVFTPIHSPSFG